MNFKQSFIILFLIFAGCIQTHKHFTAEFTAKPERIVAGKPFEMIFQIKNPQGEKVSELEIVHEKPLHLFIVSNDLAQYFHEHPLKQTDGTYRLPFTFPNGGKFKIFIDFKPPGAEQTTEAFDVEAEGEKLKEIELVPEKEFDKTVEGLRIRMKPSGELTKQTDLMLHFEAYDAETGEPAEDLQNYLGAKAHFVIIRKGLGRFVHAHPVGAGEMTGMNHGKMSDDEIPAASDASKIAAKVNFPNSGIYKLFAQFKRNDRIITVPFVFEVKG